ncbi:MAG: long-chain fatty acid transport protein [Gammaproteobacteria bacterium]|jgi:long-chain fatty acid transport protein
MKINEIIVFIILMLAAQSACATNGYFMIGYGAKSIGLAGSGVALPQDRLVGALNPAGFSEVAAGWDFGMRMSRAVRKGAFDCRGIFACNDVVDDRSSREVFVVPNFGWSRHLSERSSVGVTVYGNGGINTTYGRNFYTETAARIMGGRPGDPGFPRTGKIGVDFTQLFIAPSFAYKVGDNHSVGISPIFGVRRFSTRGFEVFAPISSDPTSLTGRGTDYSVGGGVRVGWIGRLSDSFALGAQYTSPVWFQRAVKYNGLLANGGEFNAPQHYTLGLAWSATPRLDIAFDVQRILWGEVDSLANTGPTAAELQGMITPARMLGANGTIGFGWIDQTIFKLGLSYRHSDRFTLRTGWNHGSSQIPNRETLLNVIAPATINDNATVGFSVKIANYGELSATYMRAFEKKNRNRATAFFGTSVSASIVQDWLDVAWSADF